MSDTAARAALGAAWGATLPDAPGLDYDAILNGSLKALYVMGADPLRSATPEQRTRLAATEFLVVQDLFLTETAQAANVVLPAVAYTEKDGSFTNTDRSVQVIRKAMLELPGARADWAILTGRARRLGLDWGYQSPAEVLAEIGRVVPLYAGATRRTLGLAGARWPLTPGAPDGEGRATVVGSPVLTWEMLAQGVAQGLSPITVTSAGEDGLAVSSGRGGQEA